MGLGQFIPQLADLQREVLLRADERDFSSWFSVLMPASAI